MKKYSQYLLYISILVLIIFGYYNLKKIIQLDSENQKNVEFNMKTNQQPIEIIILNGCNIKDIAKRYRKLILNNYNGIYDIRKVANSDELENESRIIIHSKNAKRLISQINNLKDLLGINDSNVIDDIKNNPDYEVTVIIGKDYKLLESYEKAFSPKINIHVRD
tara:strand:+ start:335 stop:826 length:492 start_codon:yes stop_codon:yes gene_type:complete